MSLDGDLRKQVLPITNDKEWCFYPIFNEALDHRWYLTERSLETYAYKTRFKSWCLTFHLRNLEDTKNTLPLYSFDSKIHNVSKYCLAQLSVSHLCTAKAVLKFEF